MPGKQATDAPRSSYYHVLPEELTPPAKDCLFYDPRIEDGYEEDMVLDLMANGCRELVKARKEGETKEGRPILVIVDGRRRYNAALEANKRLLKDGKEPIRLKCLTVRGTDQEMFELMIQSNLGRKDDGPVRIALKMQRYEKMGKAKKEIAALFQCSIATVDNRLSLLELHEKVQPMVESGEIPEVVARELTKVERGKQLESAKEMVANGVHKGSTGIRAAKAAKNGHSLPKKEGKKMLRRPFVERFLDQVSEKKPKSEAVAVLKYVLGNKRALADFPGLKEAAEKALES